MKIIRFGLLIPFFLALFSPLLCFSQDAPPAPPQTQPQEKQITGIIKESGFTQAKIAIPDTTFDSSLSAESLEVHTTLMDDLDFSGFFKIVDPGLYTGIAISEKIDFDAWIAMGADYLLVTRLVKSERVLALEGRLYDIKRKEMVTGKRIRAAANQPRLLSHNLSSVVLDYLFGAGRFPTSQILFASQLGETQDIFLSDYDGKNLIRLSAMGILNVTPDISPKGDKVVFTSILKDRQELFFLDRAGKRTKLYGEGEGLNSSPKFSPDGKTIAFCSSKSGNPDIWSISVDGSDLTRLSFSYGIDTAPCWSPDGTKIAFTSDRSGSPQIYVMDRDGTNVKRLSPASSKRCDQPVWSPRGDKIAYTTMVDGKFNIAAIDLSTNEVTMLTHGEGDSESPAWSPDGRYMAFSSNRLGTSQIFIMRADGSGARRISNQPDCSSPCWF
jgi:TolB protein